MNNRFYQELFIVFAKELKDALRDYKAVIPALLMTIACGPFTLILSSNFIEKQVTAIALQKNTVALLGDGGELYRRISALHDVVVVDSNKFSYPAQAKIPEDPERAKAAALIESGKVDVVVSASPHFGEDLKGVTAPEVTFYFTGKSTQSTVALAKMANYLEGFRADFLKARLKDNRIDINYAPEIKAGIADDSPNAASAFLQKILPSVLLMFAFIGVVYPACDVTAGERERGTLEALISSPANRRAVFLGKLLMITVFSIVPVLIALVSFYCSQFYVPKLIPLLASSMKAVLPLPCALLVALFALPISLTLAVLTLSLASMARTVQQAQGYFVSLVFISLIPSLMTLDTSIRMDLPLAITPILGPVVAISEILRAHQSPLLILTALVSMLFAVFLALLFAPMLDREDLLFGVEEAPQRRYSEGVFSRELFFLFSIIFGMMFYISQILVVKHHIWGVAATQILIILLPAFIFVKFWLKLPLREVYRLKKPPGGYSTIACAALISPLTITLASLAAHFQDRFLPGAKELEKAMIEILGLAHEPIYVLVFVIGVLPGICEELLFRGVVQSLLGKRLTPPLLICVVGVLFGLFHMSLVRFVPTAIAGFFLAWVAYRSRSVFPSMLLHVCHNSLAVLTAIYTKNLSQKEVPDQVMAGALLVGSLFLFIFVRLTKTERKVETPPMDPPARS